MPTTPQTVESLVDALRRLDRELAALREALLAFAYADAATHDGITIEQADEISRIARGHTA
jgi:hypothetical protein